MSRLTKKIKGGAVPWSGWHKEAPFGKNELVCIAR